MLRAACCNMVASALHLHFAVMLTGTTVSIGGYILAVLVAQHSLGRAAQSVSKTIPDVVGTTATTTVADCAGC